MKPWAVSDASGIFFRVTELQIGAVPGAAMTPKPHRYTTSISPATSSTASTAHLDVDMEKRVNDTLRQLPITRVIIAHRPETIRAADRIVPIEKKPRRIVPPSPPIAAAASGGGSPELSEGWSSPSTRG
jgi:hypothetical protein